MVFDSPVEDIVKCDSVALSEPFHLFGQFAGAGHGLVSHYVASEEWRVVCASRTHW